MDEAERIKARQLKEEVYQHLLRTVMDLGNTKQGRSVRNTDERIWNYLVEVSGHPEAHNLYEALGVRRFVKLLGQYAWDASAVRKFFHFYEALKFDGMHGRQHYKLTPIQCFQFASIYGFKKADGHRLTRTAYLFVPRKFSKTTSSASLAVYDLFCGDNNAQAYVAANSYPQASICFREIKDIVKGIDRRGKHFRVNREKIFWIDGSRASSASCLSSNPKTLDGLNASTVIIDEYAQARDPSLKNVLVSSMGIRTNPLVIIITTASSVLNGPFIEELGHVLAILRGEEQNDTVFASIFMPDVDDQEGDRATWAKVQPHLGITAREDFYENAWNDAQRSAKDMLEFRTKLLNVFCIDEQKRWFTYKAAQRIMGKFHIDKVAEGTPCAVAFDLSVRDDYSAVTYTVYSEDTKKFYSYTDYYFPIEALDEHPNSELYKIWAEQGHLHLTKGDRIDVEEIAEDIIRRSARLNIIVIAYDSYKAQYLTNILSAMGAQNVLKPFSQTYGSFNLAVESTEMLAYSEPPGIELNDNPINAFCLTNCVIDTDRMENKKPLKADHNKKIDGAITLLMTIGALYNYER